MSETIPAIALAVLRDHHADEITRLTAEVALLKARVANAEHALTAANSRAKEQRIADEVREHIAERLRTQARTVNRRWAGCYRHIANELATTRRTP